jgi:hypothetical protein
MRFGARVLDVAGATFLLGRESDASIPEGEMPRWREVLHVAVQRGAERAACVSGARIRGRPHPGSRP